MGVDCAILLPLDVSVDDISKVMGMAMGAMGVLEPLDKGSVHLKVYETNTIKEIHYKITNATLIGYIDIGRYFVQVSRHKGKLYHRLSDRSFPEALAIFRRLGQVFGGILIRKDDVDDDIEFPRPDATMDNDGFTPQNNPEWNVYQRHLASTKPITKDELMVAYAESGYQHFQESEESYSHWILHPKEEKPKICSNCGQIIPKVEQ